MVTIQQARSQIAIQKAAVESQRQQIQLRTQQASLTAAQVRQQTRSSIAQRQVQAKRLEGIRQQALQTLKPIEEQLDRAASEVRSVEQQIKKQEEERAAFFRALKAFQSDDPRASFFLSGLEQDFFRQISAGKTTAIRLQQEKIIKELERKGLEPIFVNGELRGISDFLTQQSRTLEQLEPIVIDGKLVGFKDIALQLSRQLREPITVTITPPEIPPGVVRPAETRIDALIRNIKESSPQFKFIENKAIRDLLARSSPAKNLGRIIGGEKFLRSELKKILADPTGVFKFRPDQAEALGNLIAEVGEGFVLGLGVGKGITLLRGGIAKILPKALKQSKKFDDVLKVAGTLGIITLTTAQAISIKKTFEEEGEQAAILQTIGFISFGVGFGVTGLRTLPQAEKEFKQIADLLKKVIPPGKRGETRFSELGRFLKKKKKGAFGELETLSQEEVQRGREVLAAIERRLARARTPKEQAKILAEIKRGLKTPQAKRNFENFVLGLIEKDIIKLAKVEIVPGVKVKVIPRRVGVKVILPKVKTPGRLKELARVKRNQARNQARKTQSNISLGKRFAQAQAGLQITRLTSAQRTAQKQKQLQKQIIKQRTIQKTQQRLRLRQLQSQRLKSRLALRQLLRQSLRTGRKLRPRLKRFGVPLVPLIKFPKKKPVKRLPKVLPFDLKGDSFNVLTRRKGIFGIRARNLQENRAKKFLARRLDNRISASGRIIPSDKPPKFKKDIKRFNFPERMFRFPKKNSPLIKPGTFTIVERRAFRISTPGEKRALKQARKFKKIPMNLKVK